MLKTLRLRPIVVSVLLLAYAREAVCDDLVTTYGSIFNDRVEISYPGFTGGNPHSGFPLLVRLSEGSPAGFSYARVDSLGADIRFLSVEDGVTNAAPYEVDTWNTNGVSALWVRVPKLGKAIQGGRKLIMYWAPDDPDDIPDNNDPTAVWNGYAAVWHMNGGAESTTNAVTGTPGASAAAYTGLIGSALGTRNAGANGPILSAPGGTAIDAITNGAYTISGWIRVNLLAGGGEVWLYSARATAGENAFGASLLGTDAHIKTWRNATDATEWPNAALLSDGWTHFAVSHTGGGTGDVHRIYVNGRQISEGMKGVDSALGHGFTLGGLDGTAGTLNGDLDDVRIHVGELAPNWITNECAQVASTNYIGFSAFSSTGKSVYVPEPVTPDPGDDPAPGSSGDVSPDDYAGRATIVPDGVKGSTVLTNFVALVKVWEGEPAGFNPKDLPFGSDDIRFFDEQGRVLDFEIDLWDDNNVSYFWVLVPKLSKDTRLTMCWGLKAGRTLPAVDAAAVWTDYAGVWHMADAHDSTTNAAAGAFGPARVRKTDGAVGPASGTASSGTNGAILDVTSTAAIDSLTNGPFSVSGWVYLNSALTAHGALFSRATADDPAWGAQFSGGTSGDNSHLAMQTGSSTFDDGVIVSPRNWVRFEFIYAADGLTFSVDGVEHASPLTRTILNGSSGKLSVGGFVAAAGDALGINTLNGAIDEFRIRAGVQSATERTAESDQVSDDYYFTREAASWDATAVLQNRWHVNGEPTASKTVWDEGEEPAEFTLGNPWHGTSVLSYQDRSTGEMFAEMPTAGGDYRAIFTVPADEHYSELVYTINFRIRRHRPSHDLGQGNGRVLILSRDLSIADGLVYAQSYSDTAQGADRPYWVHDVDTGYDYWSTSDYYNFCGGLRHTYWAADGETRLWDLLDVRFGNTYNNAEAVYEETGDYETWTEGLWPDQNYLSWNPEGGVLVEDGTDTAEGWHEYAAQAVLCNSYRASVNSTLYTNGIGTIYFDCVNSHTDDATNGYYRIVVEMATNSVSYTDYEGVFHPVGLPTDDAIAALANAGEWNPITGQYEPVVTDPYQNADWKRLTMNVRLFRGESETNLPPTTELTLDVTAGQSYTNFYRIYIPVDCTVPARFRIRRTAINPDYTIATDYHSMILVDNVICSKPTERINAEPRGFYDPTKRMRETVGYEGAFLPSYPSVSDTEIYARVRARTQDGSKPAGGSLSSVLMHYRWRYINQQETEWRYVDIDPTSLLSVSPIQWPGVSGDLEYWFEVNQTGEFYQYADYSGLGLGLEGYSEEVASVTNRAATYRTHGLDWFTRIRNGKSTYGQIKLFVREGQGGAVKEVEMSVARDRIWRGCLQTTNAVSEGIYFRFEGRDRQDDALEDFQFNTNCWYLAKEAQTLPVSDSVVAGTSADWGRVPCDGATGHLMFQLDESTRALTIVHADWQDFNGWTDAHTEDRHFVGTSSDDATKSGVSPSQRESECSYGDWEDDIATNYYWTERFYYLSYSGVDFYSPFETAESPNGFDVGEGMWVRGAYADSSAESGMALQMAGQGRGWIQLTDPTIRPRGIESVCFDARIAQTVSPEDFAYYGGSPTESAPFLTNYTFVTRAAFDLGGNSNFTGNASLSLATCYVPQQGCYEARWEQLEGEFALGSGAILGPRPRGQRLALYRWRYEGREWKATELYAATNSASVSSGNCWNQTYSPRAIPAAHSVTNGLMPFMIGAYNDSANTQTLVIAAVMIPGANDATKNVEGVSPDPNLNSSYIGGEKGWLYLVYRDGDAKRLTRGTYGVLSANCEGVFVRPQYHPGVVSWKGKADTVKLPTQIWPDKTLNRGETASFYNSGSAWDCVWDIVDGYWVVPDGRMEVFYDPAAMRYSGLCAAPVSETVDIYTAPIGTTSWSQAPIASYTLNGFGRPGAVRGVTNALWSTDDSSVRIRAGGKITSVRTDVVVDNIQISQWRGDDWLGEDGYGGLTNFVYTSGWIADGALQLSPRRTPVNYPCSLRGPLCDGQGPRTAKRGLGLGSFSIWCRNAQTNAVLTVQIATNGVSYLDLEDLTTAPASDPRWTSVTNWDFHAMTPEERTFKVLTCYVGLHGVTGVMRVINSNECFSVRQGTDPSSFGSVEITKAVFRDEPPLDKGCWWGFNIRTLGDVTDVENRMYLPDSPYRSLYPDYFGSSLALNNSITQDCDTNLTAKGENPYSEHMPFLQTPTFASNIVGEISFRARKYEGQKGAQCAEVTLFGARTVDVDKMKDKDWDKLKTFVVSNTTYETYRFKTDAGKSFRAFRLAVTGVDGVKPFPGDKPGSGPEPVRVLLDDVLVSEAVRARLAFRNVGAFRHDISKTTYVPNVPSRDEQPIVGEGWGIQAEVYSAMLGEEVDSSVPPRVRLHYYKGLSPWGYEQWKDKATSAWLTPASDTNNFYRSSASDSPAAVIPMANSGEYVQYMLEVVYTVVNSETGGRSLATNWLESADWEVPSWYYPVDFNVSHGGGRDDRFAAFAIIDKIAPGWAWINEINLFGSFNSWFQNSDRNRQFVEVVKPVDYDLDGWKLQMLAMKTYGSSQPAFCTNTVAIFGRSIPKQKTGGKSCSYMSFIVVGNPTTTLTGEQYDGAWNFASVDNMVFNANGELGAYYPVAMQLVRPSGIIEHEVAILGTNAYSSVATSSAWKYDSTNLAARIKASAPDSHVFSLPDDNASAAASVGVFTEKGESALCWNNTMEMTPGDLNKNQYINPDYPRPGGELILVFAYVDTVFGRIRQTVGSGTNTTEMQTVSLPRDSQAGVDIEYTVDPWCELGTVNESEDGTTRIPVVSTNGVRRYKVNVAKGAQKNVTVIASATVDSRLRQFGIDDRNRYTPAVLHWLEHHKDAYGNDFYGWQGGSTNDTIYLAEFLALSGNVEREMTLTEMYWLDMDPTASNMFFRAGMVRPPSQVVVEQPTYDPQSDPKACTNLRMGVYMSISNGNGRVTRNGKSVWAPDVLRGLGEGELSWNYIPSGTASGAWTSETFKVTGYLNNGLTSPETASAWVPLRYFVFWQNSFDANFEAEIDVYDPFSMRSPAYSQGWYRYVQEHGGVKPPVYMSWNIDERLQPITAEILAPTNRLDGTVSP